jgi:retron-type reverse transcriptase
VLNFAQRLEENIITLQNELIWHEYSMGRYRNFYVYEPKKRQVAALPFRDRVLQHALVSAIEPIYEERFLSCSYACRPGKGAHLGADVAQQMLRKVKRNHGNVYVLKADIRHYFASIDHDVLKKMLRKKIACPETLWLLDTIIDSTPGPGIPIGNLTSQLFANVYLHELDCFVKHDLRAANYMRYMDDFIVVSHNKDYLYEIRVCVTEFLAAELKLQTNDKTQIFPVAKSRGRALDFLGYKIWTTHRKLRKDSVRKVRQKLARHRAGKLDTETVLRSIRSWTGHAGHANSYNLRQKLAGGNHGKNIYSNR